MSAASGGEEKAKHQPLRMTPNLSKQPEGSMSVCVVMTIIVLCAVAKHFEERANDFKCVHCATLYCLSKNKYVGNVVSMQNTARAHVRSNNAHTH